MRGEWAKKREVIVSTLKSRSKVFAKENYVKPEPQDEAVIVELDEMWHYLHSKKDRSGFGNLIAVIPVHLLTGNVEDVTTLRCHIRPALGGHKLKTLSVHDIRVAIESLQAKDCSERTVQKCLQILSACFKCAMRAELIFRNVAQIVEKPKHVPKSLFSISIPITHVEYTLLLHCLQL